MRWDTAGLGLLGVITGAGAAGMSLRGSSHLLRSDIGLHAPKAGADTRFGGPLPLKAVSSEQLIAADLLALSSDSVTAAGQPEGWCARSARQHLPPDPGACRASVAGAKARGGHAIPSENKRQILPVLDFPEPGLDDTVAYQGYQTRFYRDSKGNTVQIYLHPQTSRVVLVWANAANESVGFSARDASGRPLRMEWAGAQADVSDSGRTRSVEYRLRAPASRIELGWFVLGSMRIERDFVYANQHMKPLGAGPFRVAEESLLVAGLSRLPEDVRRDHLRLLQADNVAELRSRLEPSIVSSRTDAAESFRVERPSLDGRNSLLLQLRVDPRRVKTRIRGQTIALETRPGSPVDLAVRVTTNATPLTPLKRGDIFNRSFVEFLQRSRDDNGAVSYRRLERQVRGVELLSSQEKLMAGLPNFATYFGRDMMMTALMMRPIWSPAMSEHVIASVLRKLGPGGEVSHEEALGGQAIREHAVVYDSLVTDYLRAKRRGLRADSTIDRAREILPDLQRTRENYHMVDDEFQLPVLAARYLADSTVPDRQKRAFLLQKPTPSASHLALLLRELRLVTSLTDPYVRNQKATNLVSFPRLDATRWRSASWRDSDAGYAQGRFAMDINVIWAPAALQSIGTILSVLPELGFPPRVLDSIAPEVGGSTLWKYLEDPASLSRAVAAWKGTRRHFALTLSSSEVRRQVAAKLAWLPADEQRYWRTVMSRHGEPSDSLTFLVISLDPAGRHLPVVNTDPATELFLNSALRPDAMLGELVPFLRAYPVGLFVEGLGPLVANDAYASHQVWERFQRDHYHGPRVVWGREVNLLLLGLANQAAASREPALNEALRRALDAVNASGLQHNELWSYEIKKGKLIPVRYGTSSDVQLWNTTNLVVQYVLSGLSAR